MPDIFDQVAEQIQPTAQPQGDIFDQVHATLTQQQPAEADWLHRANAEIVRRHLNPSLPADAGQEFGIYDAYRQQAGAAGPTRVQELEGQRQAQVTAENQQHGVLASNLIELLHPSGQLFARGERLLAPAVGLASPDAAQNMRFSAQQLEETRGASKLTSLPGQIVGQLPTFSNPAVAAASGANDAYVQDERAKEAGAHITATQEMLHVGGKAALDALLSKVFAGKPGAGQAEQSIAGQAEKYIAGYILKHAPEYIAKYGAKAAVGAVANDAATVAENALTQATVDPNRHVTDNLLESTLIGGGLPVVHDIASSLLHGPNVDRNTPQAEGQPESNSNPEPAQRLKSDLAHTDSIGEHPPSVEPTTSANLSPEEVQNADAKTTPEPQPAEPLKGPYEKTYTPQDMLDFIKVKNTGDLDAEATRQLLGDKQYVQRDVPVDDIKGVRGKAGLKTDLVKDYAKQSGETAPPIVLGEDGLPIDGKHRFIAAKARGDKTIKAYVPLESKWGKLPATEEITAKKPLSQVPRLPEPAKGPGDATVKLPGLPSEARGWTYKQMKFWADKNGYDTSGPASILTLRRSLKAQVNGDTYTPRAKTVKAVTEAAPIVRQEIAKVPNINGTQHKPFVPRTVEEFITPISSRVRDISPPMFDRLMKMEFDTGVAREGLKRDLLPKATNVAEALGGKESPKYAEFKLAVLNGDIDAAKALLPANVHGDLEGFRSTFKNLLDTQKASGVKIGDLGEGYWPRHVKDYKAFDAEFGDKSGLFEDAFDLARKVRGHPLTADEKTEIANSVLQGFGPRKPGSYGPANARERSIEKLTPQQAAHYLDPFESAFRYVDSATYASERSKFLGRNAEVSTLDDTIGRLVQNEVDAGKLNKDQQEQLRNLLNVRFTADTMMMSKTARNLKQFMYLTSLSQFRSALNQTLDVAATAASHGIGSAVQGVKAAFGLTPRDQRFVMEDIGLHDHGEEFKDVSRIAKVTDRALKYTGFKVIDRFGKESRINAAWDSIGQAAKDPTSTKFKQIEQEYRPVLGDRFDRTMADIRDGKRTEDARYLMFLDTAKVQPITLSQMPEKYLKMRDGRIMYAMKTFTLTQLDFVRRDMLRMLKTPGQRQEGLKRLASFTVLTTLIGMGKDAVQDLMRGKRIAADQVPERVINALLGVVGLNGYAASQIWSNPVDAAKNQIAPPLSWVNNVWQDVKTFGDGSGFRSVQAMPIIGDLMYYWAPFGKGSHVKEDEANKQYRAKLTDLRREAYLARQSGNDTTARQLLGVYNDRRKEGRGDGRKTPLTYSDLFNPPPNSSEGKAARDRKKKAAVR